MTGAEWKPRHFYLMITTIEWVELVEPKMIGQTICGCYQGVDLATMTRIQMFFLMDIIETEFVYKKK